MSVFLLTWNPKIWKISDEDWREQIQLISSGRTIEQQWSIGTRTKGIHAGDIFFLVRVAKDRGIVASGVAVSVAFKDLHFDATRAKKNDLANYVMVEWETQVAIENRLAIEVLLADFPEVPWNHLYGSGVRVADEVADELVTRWLDHIGLEPETYPDETPTYVEGGSKQVLVNRHERNPAARRECLQIHGTACLACGFDGSSVFGPDGDGLIHVHHLLELATVGKEYEVNPKTDLIPLCPNCHAMIHRRRPAFSIDDLRFMLKEA
jgi:5-methylcytosine-specific restriction protein A